MVLCPFGASKYARDGPYARLRRRRRREWRAQQRSLTLEADRGEVVEEQRLGSDRARHERALRVALDGGRQSRDDGVGYPGPHGCRNGSVGFSGSPVEQRPRVSSIAGKQLVAAFAGEHDLHVPGRELRDEIQRHARRVGDRLVLVPDETGERAEVVMFVDDHFVRVRANRAGDLPRVIQLAEGAILERDRERLQRTVDHFGHDRGNRAAIEAAREEHPERHVRHQSHPHGFLEELAETTNGIPLRQLLTSLGRLAHRHIPITPDANGSVLEGQRMSRQQALNAFEERPRSGERPDAQLLGDPRVVCLGSNESAFEDCLDLGTENHPVAGQCPVERFDPQAIASEEQPGASSIPDREGKHPAEPLHAGVTPLLVGVNDRFRIGTCSIAVPG